MKWRFTGRSCPGNNGPGGGRAGWVQQKRRRETAWLNGLARESYGLFGGGVGWPPSGWILSSFVVVMVMS